LVRGAVDSQVPVFGICRGQQVINVALGGTLLQHVEGHDQHGRPRHELAHEVVVEPDSELRSVVPGGVLEVNSLHHQAVKVPAPALRVTARSHDGVVEGMESRDGLIVAVQCHPEELVERQSWALGLLRRFVERVLRSATTAARG
jgi:putative glutamine amidotransferase